MSLISSSSQCWKACFFQSFGGRERTGAAPRPCLRLAEAELVEGLVNNPHRIIHNLYYKDTEYSLDSF